MKTPEALTPLAKTRYIAAVDTENLHSPQQKYRLAAKGRRLVLRTSRVERNAPCYRVRPLPHRTVHAVFPHTALRVEVCIHRSRSPNLFSIVSLWSRRHRSTWTSSLRLAASSADCPSLDVPFPFVIHPLMFYQYSVNYSK